MKENNKLPTISIIIPTYTSSERYIRMCIEAANNQSYPKDKFEVIVADNNSKDNTVTIAKSLGARVFYQEGKPSQACAQRNLGAKNAKSEYLLFLDHDMEMSPNLLQNFAEHVAKTKGKIDAWFVPEQIKASSLLLEKIRNFERRYYDATIIDAVRIIKKEKFNKTKERYDQRLSNGPADWDMDLQLKEIGCTFGIIDEGFRHHEELLSFSKYISKKSIYISGENYYLEKWTERDGGRYLGTVKKQYSLSYRFFKVFFENKNWIRSLTQFYMLFLVFAVRFMIGIKYLNAKRRQSNA